MIAPPSTPHSQRAAWLSLAATDVGLDLLVLLFGLWTLCCHITVLCHGTGWFLFRLFGAALVVISGGYVAWRARIQGSPASALPEQQKPRSLATPQSSARWIQPVGLLAAGLVVGAWAYQHDGLWFWRGGLIFALASAVYLLARPLPPPTAADDQLPERVALFLLALFGGAVAACLNMPNSDDVLYINIGVALADKPKRELFAFDTIHGGGMALLAPYSVHSFELLAGYVSRYTRIPAVHVVQLVFGPVAGFLIAYAWARLLRLLEPARWIWLVAIIIADYALDGTGERSIAGHAFIRLFQGKAVLLTVAVPLLSAYAIEYAQQPSRRRWLLLAAAVIGGVGLSSTGLWLAPAVAGTALLVPLSWRWSYWRAVALGLVTCLYPVALGLHIRAKLVSDGAIAADSTAEGPPGLVGDYWQMLNNTFMDPRPTVVYLVCLVLAWPLARTALARRYLVAFSLIGVAVLLNPALNGLVSAYITGSSTHARVLWYLPFTLAFAICVAAPIEARLARHWRALGALVSCAALVVFAQKVPTQSAFALAPLTFPPQLKVYREGFEVAQFVTDTLGYGTVLAPAGVSLALPMIQHHPYPLMTKPKFFATDSDGGVRFRMRRIIDGKFDAMAGRERKWFHESLDRYKVAGVVVPLSTEAKSGMLDTLVDAGFDRVATMNGMRIWTRQQHQ